MDTTLFSYLLESSICLMALYLFYRVLLRKEVFFMWNRLFIIAALVLSMVLPLIDIPLSPQVRYLPDTSGLPVLTVFAADGEGNTLAGVTPAEKQKSNGAGSIPYLLTVYLSICVLLFGRLLWQVGKLVHFGYVHTKNRHKGYRLIYTNGCLPTCSFFRLLFWDNTQALTETKQTLILQHELAHIRQWHSADAMLIELIKVFYWFNPVVYLFKKSLEEVHEYLADAAVTQQYDARQYRQVMMEQVFTRMNFTFTQYFNHSLITKRIAMIQMNKPLKPAFWKMALSLPLIALLFFIYSCRTSEVTELGQVAKENTSDMYRMGEVVVVGYGIRPVIKDGNEKFNKYNLPVPLNNREEEVYEGVDKAPSPVNGMANFQKAIQQTIGDQGSADVPGTVYVQVTIDAEGNILNPSVLHGMGGKYDAQAVEAISKSPTWNPGKKDGNAVSTRIVIPVFFGTSFAPNIKLSDAQELPQAPIAGQPVPQEGMEAFYKHIRQNLRYPQEARSNLVSGQVIVGFTVQKDGTLANIQVEESLFPALDSEVVRVIQEFKHLWKPAMGNGQAQESRIILPVTFKIG